MALATRCTSCSTIFRISTAQAAAKGGAVRCGACNNVFNSLDALVRVEDLDVIEEVTIEPAAAPTHTFDPVAIESDTPEADTEADVPAPAVAGTSEPPQPEHASAAVVATGNDTGSLAAESTLGAASFMFDHESGRPVTAPVAPRGAVINEWWMPSQDDERRFGPDEPLSIAGPEGRTSGAVTTLVTRGPMPDDEDIEAPPEASEPAFLRPEPPAEATPRAVRWAFALLSLAAALVLVAQLAYWYRDDVAVQWPPARPWLAAACQPLGCEVGYPVHAESITIESAAVQTAGANPNAYVLVALLRNRDVVALRYPTLELVLTDVQDHPVLRRDLRPEDYLAGVAGHAPSTGFPAESELPVRIAFELTDLRFAGYRLNQIYR